jgi:hypothetical protein
MGVVHGSRSIDAEANPHTAGEKEVAPVPRDQDPIRLDGVGDFYVRRREGAGDRDRVLVEGDWHDKRLAGVPDEGEFGPDAGAAKDVRQDRAERAERHCGAVRAIRKVTVVAVAERGRLNDEER